MLKPKIFELENKLVFLFVFHYEGSAVEAEFVCTENLIEDLAVRYKGPAELALVRSKAEIYANELIKDHITNKTE
ncbi:hypothetical protein CEF21_19135 [Bacillus sp. FJAT-42376]|uniref:hypothetical protein n=1 Tax=Bacillus sp. FJAT-42376 TaxID=2014076 RepID=UPI000F501E41|nr:hypothetical protein [Bacillus sp. FJAT-42376]AZB44236.1 hypothetical protein CEF21_19135 [Bacillus sp. FJAT-42376]